MAKIIKLTQGCYAHVDDDVFEWARNHKWFAHIEGHIFYCERKQNRRVVRIHREIMETKPGERVDHRDGNGLNNLRSNLRNCTPAENGRNRKVNKNNSSGLRGVSWSKPHRKYHAHIRHNYELLSLEYFTDRPEAGIARDRAAIRLHGEFASLNFPKENYV